MPDSRSCICIPYREVHYRQSVEIQQEIAIPDVPLERSPSYSAALRRLAVMHKREIKVSQNAKFLQQYWTLFKGRIVLATMYMD